VQITHRYSTIDVCGTGGDGLHTLNVSTAVSFVAAGGGLKVAKHGNRALSSKSGAADVLTALGVNIAAGPAQQLKALEEAGICFLFAPAHHGAMRHVTPIRAELGFRTIFNLLGPLTNPAGATHQLIGTYSPVFVEKLAHALARLGSHRAMVVHGSDGMDEITTTGPSLIATVDVCNVSTTQFDPLSAGIPRARPDDLTARDLDHAAQIIRDILAGSAGPARDIVLLNAAAALVVAGAASDLSSTLPLAAASIDSGRAATTLDSLARASQATP